MAANSSSQNGVDLVDDLGQPYPAEGEHPAFHGSLRRVGLSVGDRVRKRKVMGNFDLIFDWILHPGEKFPFFFFNE